MQIFIISDIHYDFLLDAFHGNSKRIFRERFLPADTVCVAGDISNTLEVTKLFLKEVSERYKNVVVCPGNHDLAITWDEEGFKTSEEKIDALQKLCDSFPNVHFLNGRTEVIDGVKFGGTMGFWDFSFLEMRGFSTEKDYVRSMWRSWFDGVNWNYLGQDWERIRSVEFGKLQVVLSEKPDVMMTHFSPLPKRLPPTPMLNFIPTFFYFDSKITEDYLAKNKNAIWIAGHTHTAFIQERLFVHPNAYPEECPRVFNNLKRKHFLIEI